MLQNIVIRTWGPLQSFITIAITIIFIYQITNTALLKLMTFTVICYLVVLEGISVIAVLNCLVNDLVASLYHNE